MRWLILLLLVPLACGCHVKSGIDKGAESKAKNDANDEVEIAPPPQVEPKPAPAENGDDKGIIGKMTDEVLDYEQAVAENPNLREVELKAQGDYLSFMASAYVNVRAKVSMLQMEHELNIIKQLEERNPTYDEMMKIMKQYQIQFTMLPRYRKYAYHAKDGRFAILEDPAKKPQP